MTEREFISAMCEAGLVPAKGLDFPEGQLVRFRVEGDKAGSRNGWAVLHRHPIPAGAFGSWRTGETYTWRGELDRPMTTAERTEQRRQLQAVRAVRMAEQAKVRAEARARAQRLWELAKPASAAHPYLQAKRVHAYGIRRLRDALVIAARDAGGVLHTLQFIDPDGRKRFLSGGRIQGCYFSIGRPAGRLLLAEGYATAATLYEATGEAVACCFNAGNLLPVSRELRAKFPRLRLVVCADNDTATPGNPGVSAALAAARAVGAWVAIPQIEEPAHE